MVESAEVIVPSQQIWIPARLPCLNDLIAAKRDVVRVRGRVVADGYAKLKAKWGHVIGVFARSWSFLPIESGHFTYVFREPNRKRDPSNVIAGGVKLIEDALQEADLLRNDGWANVLSIDPKWEVSPTPGVLVTVAGAVLWQKPKTPSRSGSTKKK